MACFLNSSIFNLVGAALYKYAGMLSLLSGSSKSNISSLTISDLGFSFSVLLADADALVHGSAGGAHFSSDFLTDFLTLLLAGPRPIAEEFSSGMLLDSPLGVVAFSLFSLGSSES